MQCPLIAKVNLVVFSLFMLIAGLGTLIPYLVMDRRPVQFEPLWRALLRTPNEGWSRLPERLATASQWIIGVSELGIGMMAGAAMLFPARRRLFATLSLSGATALFGSFMVTLFLIHDKSLPAWNQYPAILIWIAAIWGMLHWPLSVAPPVAYPAAPSQEGK